MKYHFILIGMVKVKRLAILTIVNDMEQLEFSYKMQE